VFLAIEFVRYSPVVFVVVHCGLAPCGRVFGVEHDVFRAVDTNAQPRLTAFPDDLKSLLKEVITA
jgi:hypothetical protein